LKELEVEQQKPSVEKLSLAEKQTSPHPKSDQFAVHGVFYSCPLIGNDMTFKIVRILN